MTERDPNLEEEMNAIKMFLYFILGLVILVISLLVVLLTSCSVERHNCDAYGNGKVYVNSKK